MIPCSRRTKGSIHEQGMRYCWWWWWEGWEGWKWWRTRDGNVWQRWQLYWSWYRWFVSCTFYDYEFHLSDSLIHFLFLIQSTFYEFHSIFFLIHFLFLTHWMRLMMSFHLQKMRWKKMMVTWIHHLIHDTCCYFSPIDQVLPFALQVTVRVGDSDSQKDTWDCPWFFVAWDGMVLDTFGVFDTFKNFGTFKKISECMF